MSQPYGCALHVTLHCVTLHYDVTLHRERLYTIIPNTIYENDIYVQHCIETLHSDCASLRRGCKKRCAKGAGQHASGQSLPSTFTNQTVCQPIGTEVFGEDILLLVDKTGLVCKYVGQALTFDIWPAPFVYIFW